nr:DUF2500 domain-containing protein [Oscillospiraceae bacterium]
MYTPFGIRMGFQFVNILSILMFLIVSVLIIAALIRSVSQWSKDEKSPRLTVEARVIGKRTAHRRTMSDKRTIGRDYTNYYATFQFESGDRMELELKGHEYGLIVEGDKGKLTFQGTRYLGFERI